MEQYLHNQINHIQRNCINSSNIRVHGTVSTQSNQSYSAQLYQQQQYQNALTSYYYQPNPYNVYNPCYQYSASTNPNKVQGFRTRTCKYWLNGNCHFGAQKCNF